MQLMLHLCSHDEIVTRRVLGTDKTNAHQGHPRIHNPELSEVLFRLRLFLFEA